MSCTSKADRKARLAWLMITTVCQHSAIDIHKSEMRTSALFTQGEKRTGDCIPLPFLTVTPTGFTVPSMLPFIPSLASAEGSPLAPVASGATPFMAGDFDPLNELIWGDLFVAESSC